MENTVGLPPAVLADAGFASGTAMAELEARNIQSLVAIARTQPHRPYDFRPPPAPKPARRIAEPWRLTMKAKLESEDGKSPLQETQADRRTGLRHHQKAIGFTCFHLRGIQNVAAEWLLAALAYDCRRLHRLQLA